MHRSVQSQKATTALILRPLKKVSVRLEGVVHIFNRMHCVDIDLCDGQGDNRKVTPALIVALVA